MNAFAVQLTGPAMGAIAIIALFGDDARSPSSPASPPKSHRHISCRKILSCHSFNDPATDTPIDDALIVYTADNAYELHVHGGTAVVETILRSLHQAGAQQLSLQRLASAGYFGNLLHAELLTTLPTATTLTAARLLAAQTTEGLAAWSRQ